jgi:hypothetical protein
MQINLSELISAISSVAAFVTAIIVFFTLLEMIRQRQSSYKPDLVCKSTQFYVSADVTGTLQYTISTEDNGDKGDRNRRYPQGRIFNIGLGSAKSLNLTWRFDHERAIEDVKRLNLELGLSLFVKDNILTIKGKSGGNYINLANAYLQNIDYILPVSITNKPVSIDIPFSYVHLLSIYSIFQIYNDSGNPLNFLSSFPHIWLTIKFKDVGGRIYKKKYGVNARYQYIGRGGGDDRISKNIKFGIFIEFEEL